MGRSTGRVRFPEGNQIEPQLQDLFEGLQFALGDERFANLRGNQLSQELALTERFGELFSSAQQDIRNARIQDDDLARALRNRTIRGVRQEGAAREEFLETALSGIEGLEGGGLPTDVENRISERARSEALKRGINLDTSNAAMSEIASLIGGEENLRSNRLNQLNVALGRSSAITQPGFSMMTVPNAQQFGLNLPDNAQLMGFGLQQRGQLLNARMTDANNRTQLMMGQMGLAGDIGMAVGMS